MRLMKAVPNDPLSKSSARVAKAFRYLSEDLALSADEMRSLRAQLDEWLTGHATASPVSTPRRTLYLPREPLDDL